MNFLVINEEQKNDKDFKESLLENEKPNPSQKVNDTLDIVNNKNFQRAMRLIVFIIVMLGLVIGKLWMTPADTVECMVDPLHKIFSFMNDWINENHDAAVFFQISSSFLMDFTFFVLFFYWVLYVKSCRLIIAIILFYGLRAINQLLIQMTFPEGFYWEATGFPSFVVPYGRTSDFFFSGHVGFLSICTYEWYMLKIYKMMFLTILINIYMIFVLLSFRTHYSIDITTGLIVAHWLFFIVVKYEHYGNDFIKKIFCKGVNLMNEKILSKTKYFQPKTEKQIDYIDIA